jgi:hypothetical protein
MRTLCRHQSCKLSVEYGQGPTHAQVQNTTMLPQFHRAISYFKVDSEQHAKDARLLCV